MSGVDGNSSAPEAATIDAKEIASIIGMTVATVREWRKRTWIREPIDRPAKGFAWWRVEIYEDLGRRGYGPWAHKYAPSSSDQRGTS